MHCESGASIVKDTPIYLSPSVTHFSPLTQLCLCSPRGFFLKGGLFWLKTPKVFAETPKVFTKIPCIYDENARSYQ